MTLVIVNLYSPLLFSKSYYLLFMLDLSSLRNLRHNHQAILYTVDVALFAFAFVS